MKAAYFSHDENARNDPKITKVRMKYGIEGYGCYFAILEMFYSEASHSLDFSQEQFEAIAYDLHVQIDVKEFIEKCIDIGLFQSDGSRFWSDSFNRRVSEVEEKAAARSKAAAKAIAARWAKRDNEQKGTSSESKPNNNIVTPEATFSIDGIDPEWRRVVQEYESNLGLIPVGIAGERLISYYEDMGADVMIEAIKVTNINHPNNPATYLNAILKKWMELGIDSVEKAKAAIIDHGRRKGAQQRAQARSEESKQEQPTIRGEFY